MSGSRERVRRYEEAIRRVLMEAWDPIGVAHVAEAQDEYDSYVAGICGRLMRGAQRQELVDYLWKIETDYMGLQGDRKGIERVVGLLLKLPAGVDSR